MCLYRRSALWAGCGILVLVFVAAEELADKTSAAPAIIEAAAPQFFQDLDYDLEEPANDTAEDAVESDVIVVDVAAAPESPPVLVVTTANEEPSPALAVAPAVAKREKDSSNHRSGRTVNRVCRVTAYCDRGLTAAGVPSGVGQCAAPADIPLGSTVYIPALHRKFVVTDRTHKRFRHNTVDLFIASEKQCRKFGRKYLACEFTVLSEPARYGDIRLAQATGH